VLLFHESSLESTGDDAVVLELTDYCARKVVMLNDPTRFKTLLHVDDTKVDHDAKAKLSVQQVISKQSMEMDYKVRTESMLCRCCADACLLTNASFLIYLSFIYVFILAHSQICISCLSILRYLTQHLNVIPLSAMVRMLDTHDFILQLVPLLENMPWQRTHVYREGGKKKRCQEKFIEQQWVRLDNDDRFQLTQVEGQVWLSIYNLVCDLKCRQRYRYDMHRKAVIVRLKRFFNSMLIDQLPMLTQLQRSVEELLIMQPPLPTAKSFTIVEQVLEIRADLFEGVDWARVARVQSKTVYADTKENRDRDIQRFDAAYNLNNFDDVLSKPPCVKCGKPAVNRCSVCKNEWYCSNVCHLDSWKKHKPICVMLQKDAQTRNDAKSVKKEAELQQILRDNEAMASAGDTGGIQEMKQKRGRVRTDNSMLDLEGGAELNEGVDDAVSRFADANNVKRSVVIEEVDSSAETKASKPAPAPGSSSSAAPAGGIETLEVKSKAKPSLIDVLMASKSPSSSSPLSLSSSSPAATAASSSSSSQLIQEVNVADAVMEQTNTNVYVEELD
jgi:hypothetical protein